MNHYKNPTALEESANAEAMIVFKEHLNQFNANCDALRHIERNRPTIANEATQAAVLSSGRGIQTDDGTEWQHDLDLTNVTSICHRHTPAGLAFAIVERLPLESREMKEVLNSGHDLQDVLQAFARDQRQVLRLWKDDLTAQVREYLAEKHPQQDLNIVVESFEIKLARAILQTHGQAQSQSRGVRI